MLLSLLLIGLALYALSHWPVHPHTRAAWLLAPCCPLLGWGPLTHCYLNHKARTLALEDPDTDPAVRQLLAHPTHGERYIQHAVDPDIIKAYHFLYKETHYEYAHNPLPNRYFGRPHFGHALWNAAETPDEQLMALGWLSHQVADQFAHNAPFDRFFGYVNREVIFGHFWDEVMHHLSLEHSESLGGAFYSADHWMTELLIDAYALATLGEDFKPAFLLQRRPMPMRLLERVSPHYLREHRELLTRDYADASEALSGRLLRRCREFCDLVNAGSWHYTAALVEDHGADAIRDWVLSEPRLANLQTVLDLAASQVARAIGDPSHAYQPRTLNDAALRLPDQTPEAVLGPPLEVDLDTYWNHAIYKEYRQHKQKKGGWVAKAFAVAPMGLLRWTFQELPITRLKGPFVDRILPTGRGNLGLALRYAYALRTEEWLSPRAAGESVLRAKALLGEGPLTRVRTF